MTREQIKAVVMLIEGIMDARNTAAASGPSFDYEQAKEDAIELAACWLESEPK